MRKFTLALLAVCLIALASTAPAKAASSQLPQTTIVPFLQTVKIQANEPTKTFDLTITNNSTKTQAFHLSVLNFGTLNESGGLVFAGSNANTLIKKYGLASWLRLSTNDLTLGPSQSATIQATIINDVSLAPGGHYGAVVASVNSQDAAEGNQVNVKQQLSSLILATKVGGDKYDLSLSGIHYDINWGKLPDKIVLRFKNNGNVQVVPRGIVKLVSPRGHTVSQGTINEASSYVLPETYRQIPVDLHSVAKESWWPKFYRIAVYYRYDGIDSFAAKTYTLYLVNLPAMIVSLFVFVLLMVLVVKLWRYEIRRRSKPKLVPKVAYRKPTSKAKASESSKKPKKSNKNK